MAERSRANGNRFSHRQPLLPTGQLPPPPPPPPLCSVFLESLLPPDLAHYVPRQIVGVDETALSAITREVYWFVLARHLAPAVQHFCQANNLPIPAPSQFGDIDNADLLIHVLSSQSSVWYKGPSAPQVFHVNCAMTLASSPWNAARVGFFIAFSVPYRCLDTRQSIASLLARVRCYAHAV
jgi:hypothetical protein